MSQGNVEVVQRCYELMNRRDWESLLEMVDRDIELDLSRNVFNPDVYHGHADLRRYERAVDEVWDEFHGEPTEFVDAGDKVVTAATLRGKGKGSGVEVEMHVFNVWTLRDSRVVHVVGGYRDRSEALRDAGLPEQARSTG